MRTPPVPLTPRATGLTVAISFAFASLAQAAPAPTFEFSEGFLIGGQAIDMRRYANGNPLPAGMYTVDVQLNGESIGSHDVRFVASDDPFIAQPCLDSTLLRRIALKPDYQQALQREGDRCLDLPTQVPGATVGFDSNALLLAITVPQAAQLSVARGFVAPEFRDDGITAGFIDYSANHYRSRGRDNSYLGLNAGVNAGRWRLRHRASFSHSAAGTRYDVISSHAQRDIAAWNSQLMLGQGNTGGELFESVAFTGARLATDERMLPDSLRGYAPVVQGIAEGNARVTIRQNGNIIHESNVAPGPFSIEDLYPTSFGGDLEVTVTEADGREQRFNVNFSVVPQALRAGASRFAVTAGELRDSHDRQTSLRFGEATYARGLSNHLTVLGGVQAGQHYRSVLGGAAVNTAIGAFGADVTHSRAQLRGNERLTGNSLRLNYQRYVARSGTNFGLAAYRYSTRNFLTLNDAARAVQDDWGQAARARQRYQVNFSQKLGARTSLHLSGGHVAYWDSSRRQNDFQLGLQSSVGRVNYGLSAMRYRLAEGRLDTRYAFTLSMPLGRSANAPRASTQLSHADGGRQTQLGLSGAVGETRALSYSLSSSGGGGGTRSSSAYTAWQGNAGHFNAGYSRTQGQGSLMLGAAGTLAVHSGGLTLGPPAGDGFVLVQAPGAQGARLNSSSGARIGRSGYALLPHVSPYRWNSIDLDPSGLPIEVELLQTSHRVAPTAGGIVRVPFEVRRERTLFIDATDVLGQPLPFAARIESDSGQALGAVGQGGVIQLRGAQDEGSLIVDPDGPHRCRIDYRMPDAPDAYGLSWNQRACQPLPVPGLQVIAPANDGGDPREVSSP